MNKIPDEIKEKIKEIAPSMMKDEDLAMYLKLEEIAESLEKIAQKEMPEMPKMEMPEVHKVQIEGFDAIQIKGEKGDSIIGPRGPKGDKGDSIVGPMGPAGRDGESIIGPAGKDGINGSPDTPDQVKEKLLEAELTIEDIKDLRKELDDLKKKWTSRPIFGGGLSKGVADGLYAPIGTTGAAISVLAATGTVDDSNLIFTFASAPTLVVVNGTTYREGHGVSIVGTTATLDNPVGVGGDIYGI